MSEIDLNSLLSQLKGIQEDDEDNVILQEEINEKKKNFLRIQKLLGQTHNKLKIRQINNSQKFQKKFDKIRKVRTFFDLSGNLQSINYLNKNNLLAQLEQFRQKKQKEAYEVNEGVHFERLKQIREEFFLDSSNSDCEIDKKKKKRLFNIIEDLKQQDQNKIQASSILHGQQLLKKAHDHIKTMRQIIPSEYDELRDNLMNQLHEINEKESQKLPYLDEKNIQEQFYSDIDQKLVDERGVRQNKNKEKELMEILNKLGIQVLSDEPITVQQLHKLFKEESKNLINKAEKDARVIHERTNRRQRMSTILVYLFQIEQNIHQTQRIEGIKKKYSVSQSNNQLNSQLNNQFNSQHNSQITPKGLFITQSPKQLTTQISPNNRFFKHKKTKSSDLQYSLKKLERQVDNVEQKFKDENTQAQMLIDNLEKTITNPQIKYRQKQNWNHLFLDKDQKQQPQRYYNRR